MEEKKKRYCVIGAGNGGRTMAAHLALMDFEVTLYNRTFKNIASIEREGGIYLKSNLDDFNGFGKIPLATSDIEEAITGNDIIMIVVPAFAHHSIATKVAPYLQDGQIVILNPGRTLGALEFRRALNLNNCKADVSIAETQTFIYASRSEGSTQARIFKIKKAVPLAAFPSSETKKVLHALKPAFPQFIDGGNIIKTGLNNIGGVFHPTISILNTGRIEASDDFQFYVDGVTPTIARIMESIDRERVNVAAACGFRATTAIEWLNLTYRAKGKNLFEAIHNQKSYRGINAPNSLDHRYLHEDIPMSLVPIASIGRQYGVSVEAIESLIHLAAVASKKDYWKAGRTMESLGISHLNRRQLLRMVNGQYQEQMVYIPSVENDLMFKSQDQHVFIRAGENGKKQSSAHEAFIG